jgi:hypothetical protein
MPTPGGKPKVGERVRWRATADSEWQYGTVLRRTDGTLWSIRVRHETDDPYRSKERWITEASYYVDRGLLEVLPPKFVKPDVTKRADHRFHLERADAQLTSAHNFLALAQYEKPNDDVVKIARVVEAMRVLVGHAMTGKRFLLRAQLQEIYQVLDTSDHHAGDRELAYYGQLRAEEYTHEMALRLTREHFGLPKED